MKSTLTLALLPLIFAIISAQTQSQCLENCLVSSENTQTDNCCGCCGSTQSCHQIAEQAVCCDAGQSYCGCLSSRAFCDGDVWGSSTASSIWGVCYNASAYNCLYNPGPNMWVLCPTATFPQTCAASSSSSALPVCCESASTCASGLATGLGNINYCTGTCGDLSCASGQGCCVDNATGHRCYDVTLDSCSADAAGGYTLCPLGYEGCAGACYNSTDYCCPSGVLTQIQFC